MGDESSPWDGLAAPGSPVSSVIDSVNSWILDLATSPWVLLAVFLVVWLDGFFPPVPAQALVVAAAAAFAAARNWPMEILLPLVAAAGAVAGDVTGYALGRFLKASHWRVFRRGKGEAALGWAERVFTRSGTRMIIMARYIPIGRAAVNLTAGSLRFSFNRFVRFDAVGGLAWGLFTAVFGAVAGRTTNSPVLNVAVGVVCAIVAGLLVQWIVSRMFSKADPPEAN